MEAAELEPAEQAAPPLRSVPGSRPESLCCQPGKPVRAQAERAAIAPVSLHAAVAFVEILSSDDVAVNASVEHIETRPQR
jgi:hypothetical protein